MVNNYMFNNHLMKACLAAVITIGLAACSSSDSGSDNGTDTSMPTTPPGPSALETATELAGRLENIDAAQLLADATKYAGMLTAEMVNGESADAVANANKVLMAQMAIEDAVTAADAVLEEVETAKMSVDDIQNAAEKDAVMRLLDNAMKTAAALKKAAQGIIAATGEGSLDAAVDTVVGTNPAAPKTAADAGEAVAAGVATALASITDSGTPPDHATMMNDASAIGAMTWAEIVGDAVVKQRISAGTGISGLTEVSAAPVSDDDVSLVGETAPTLPDAGDNANLGSELDQQYTHMGIPGRVFCAGSDCSVNDDGDLTGSWHFRPESAMELYVADPTTSGSYTVALMYARYGYWLDYGAAGAATGIVTTAAVGNSGTNTAGLDLVRPAAATDDVTATYTGSAAGVSVRGKTSGHFTADVNLTATFKAAATDSTLAGSIRNFQGAAANPAWVITLSETTLTAAGALSAAGVAYGGAAAGAWTAQAYGPAAVDHDNDAGTAAVPQRPTGFFGRFNANFTGDGAAAGAYAARASQ